MAMPLAPYHDGMRIGQGFNSFTQEIRMDNAVLYDAQKPAETKASSDEGSGSDVSQIVSYSARFVEKLTEVTTAMNISGPMSIKAGVVGGANNGSFIDSDKFRHADLNFFVQVKVTNQVKIDLDSHVFSPLPNYDAYTPQSFVDVYGDAFISGFIEGGEFDALISIKANPGSSIDYLKWYVERQFSTFGTVDLAQALEEDIYDEERAITHRLHHLAETTIVINWSGGGFIKPMNTLLTLENIPRIASNFARNAAATPQKLYAILNPYLSLRTFRVALPALRPLDYTNATIYTGELVDNYMEYRFILNNLRNVAEMVRSGEATLYASVLRPEVAALVRAAYTTAVAAHIDGQVQKGLSDLKTRMKERGEPVSADKLTEHALALRQDIQRDLKDEDTEHLHQYPPNLLGIERARRDCRGIMLQIVHEVDLITLDPTIAEEPDRRPAFLSPDIFIDLVPKHHDISPRHGRPRPGFGGDKIDISDGEDMPSDEEQPPHLRKPIVPAPHRRSNHRRIPPTHGNGKPNNPTRRPKQPSILPGPRDPVEPGRPTYPTEPIYPERPTRPRDPRYPKEPKRPEYPGDPPYPRDPEQPEHPRQPEQPKHPKHPEYPPQPRRPSDNHIAQPIREPTKPPSGDYTVGHPIGGFEPGHGHRHGQGPHNDQREVYDGRFAPSITYHHHYYQTCCCHHHENDRHGSHEHGHFEHDYDRRPDKPFSPRRPDPGPTPPGEIDPKRPIKTIPRPIPGPGHGDPPHEPEPPHGGHRPREPKPPHGGPGEHVYPNPPPERYPAYPVPDPEPGHKGPARPKPNPAPGPVPHPGHEEPSPSKPVPEPSKPVLAPSPAHDHPTDPKPAPKPVPAPLPVPGHDQNHRPQPKHPHGGHDRREEHGDDAPPKPDPRPLPEPGRHGDYQPKPTPPPHNGHGGHGEHGGHGGHEPLRPVPTPAPVPGHDDNYHPKPTPPQEGHNRHDGNSAHGGHMPSKPVPLPLPGHGSGHHPKPEPSHGSHDPSGPVIVPVPEPGHVDQPAPRPGPVLEPEPGHGGHLPHPVPIPSPGHDHPKLEPGHGHVHPLPSPGHGGHNHAAPVMPAPPGHGGHLHPHPIGHPEHPADSGHLHHEVKVILPVREIDGGGSSGFRRHQHSETTRSETRTGMHTEGTVTVSREWSTGSTSQALLHHDGTRALFSAAAASLSSMPVGLGARFRMSSFGGAPDLPESRNAVVFFNDLDVVRSMDSPGLRQVHVWWADGAIAGLQTQLADGRVLSHGSTTTAATTAAAAAASSSAAALSTRPLGLAPQITTSSAGLALKEGEYVVGVKIFAAGRPHARAATPRPRDRKAIVCLRLITSGSETVDFWNKEDKFGEVETFAAGAPGAGWGMVGFYGELVENGGKDDEGERWDIDAKKNRSEVGDVPCIVERLGVVWARMK